MGRLTINTLDAVVEDERRVCDHSCNGDRRLYIDAINYLPSDKGPSAMGLRQVMTANLQFDIMSWFAVAFPCRQ